jgi:hypothetical protein
MLLMPLMPSALPELGTFSSLVPTIAGIYSIGAVFIMSFWCWAE